MYHTHVYHVQFMVIFNYIVHDDLHAYIQDPSSGTNQFIKKFKGKNKQKYKKYGEKSKRKPYSTIF